MSILDIIGLNLFNNACGSSICRIGSECVAACAVDKDVLVAGKVVEPVGTREENSRLADVELELVVTDLVSARQRLVSVFRHGWGSEEIRVHLCWVQWLHHLVGVDQAVVAAGLGGGDPGDRRSSAVAALGVAQATTSLHGRTRVVNFSGTPEPGREICQLFS